MKKYLLEVLVHVASDEKKVFYLQFEFFSLNSAKIGQFW